MKIAICCAEGGSTLGPFGRNSDLFILHVQNGAVVERELVPPVEGCCSGLARKVRGVDLVLCDGIGMGAMAHLVEQGTAVVRPKLQNASADEVVALWLAGAYENFFVGADECGSTGCGRHEHGSGHHHHGHHHRQ